MVAVVMIVILLLLLFRENVLMVLLYSCYLVSYWVMWGGLLT